MKSSRSRHWAALGRLGLSLVGASPLLLAMPASAAPNWPWSDPNLSPDVRANLLLGRMNNAQKDLLVNGDNAFSGGPGKIGSAGYIPPVPELGIPAVQTTDASIGVAYAGNVRGPGLPSWATPLPSSLATAATWNPLRAYAGGVMIGREASQTGFTGMLDGGVNLARDPRNGRTFEYLGEDPLLAGTMMGWAVRGIQSNHVFSTTKHYALNDQETDRGSYNAVISERAARESDLLAFEIGIELGQPGSVMCSYNKYNAVYACENDYLLNQTLKGDWHFPGFVMSDWGGVHDTVNSAVSGLDQESGRFDAQDYYGQLLLDAVASGAVPQARLDDMVRRILRTMFAVGLFDHQPVRERKDFAGDALISQASAEEGIVLLKNAASILPLSRTARSIAVIGSHADVGVLSGGGSGQVLPFGGNAVPAENPTSYNGCCVWDPSPPLASIRQYAPKATVTFDEGTDFAAAAKLAAGADVAIVFVNQFEAEGNDLPNLLLPHSQNKLVEAVAAANPHTVVVLETGSPVLMPWLDQVAGVLEAWYPGAAGGTAIGRILFGDVNPSGRLPLTFPRNASQLPRPVIPGSDGNPNVDVDYNIEGQNVGYKWFDLRRFEPLFPFGYGLSYTSFDYSGLRVRGGSGNLAVEVTVRNTGKAAGADVPQVYLGFGPQTGEAPIRLIGFQKVALPPGASQTVSVTVDPRLLATFDEASHAWRIAAGDYPVYVGASARDLRLSATAHLEARSLKP